MTILGGLLGLLPKSWIKPIAMKYVAGETTAEALKVVQQLNKQGYSATLDILGEHTPNLALAQKVTLDYCRLIELIADYDLDCNISVKPTHIGMDLGLHHVKHNAERICALAEKYGNFVRLDMENYPYIRDTIRLSNSFPKHVCGTVLQAYLMDITHWAAMLKGRNVRLCKGIYNEPNYIALKDKALVNANYLKMVFQLLAADCYVGIATHDKSLIYSLCKHLKHDKDRCEFQVLYGVPMGNTLRELKKMGYKIRVYVPYGVNWHRYCCRRLGENPKIIGFVLNDLFR